MSDLKAFYEYAQAFELAYLSDDWSVIRPLLADEAHHVVTNGGPHDCDDQGADAVVAGFREAVRVYDHRFDLRIPEVLEGPRTTDDGIWMKFSLTGAREGLPDLRVEGEHLVRVADGKIVAIEERLLNDDGARAADYLNRHDAELRPLGSNVSSQRLPERQRDLDSAIMKTLVRLYGAAQSEVDVEAALTTCHPDFVCETVCFGVATRDKADTLAQFGLFFDTFPEYVVSINAVIAEGEHVACWGSQSMTMRGGGLGMAPTGRTARQPFSCVFEFRDSQIVREIYFFDLADMCSQLGIEVTEVQATLSLLRSAAA